MTEVAWPMITLRRRCRESKIERKFIEICVGTGESKPHSDTGRERRKLRELRVLGVFVELFCWK